jgi:hypothetical protein
MNKLSKYTFIFLVQFLCAGALISQDVMRIAGTQIVKKGETMTIEAGKLVQFEAGATLLVEGSLVVRGTVEKPVIFQSVDAQNPGNGVMVKGIEEGGSIAIENVRAEGLVQALRFDPFWYRKNVTLSGMTVSGSNSGEPVVYVAGPLLDLREGMDIQFSMTSMKFFNNTGSVLLEKVGSDGIVYSLDKLLFSENNLPGSDATMGVLHLDVARTVTAGQLKIGELAFNRNNSGVNSVGLSLSGGNGTGSEKLSAGAVYGEMGSALIYDNRVNSRVPSIEIAKVGGLNGYSEEKDFVVAAKHTFGKVKMNVVGNPRVVKMEDSLGRPVFNNANRVGDTLVLSYLEGNPTVITLANGQKFMVPKLTAEELPAPVYRKIDTTMTGIGMSLDSFIAKLRDSLEMQDIKWKSWNEYGIWTGGAIYQGDYKHRYTVLPSTIELSTGLYAQFKPFKRNAFRVGYYNAKISMHSILAPGLFSGMATPKLPTTLSKGGYFEPTNIWRFNFTTSLNILDLEALFYLNRARNINFSDPTRWKMLSMFGIGTSLIHYDPKRMVVTNIYTMVPLRPLGTEGQNFLPGKKPYSSITGSLNLAYNIVFQKNRWVIKGEIKKVFSFSDYLDDWGSGQWFGGDYDKWRASLPAGNIDPFSGEDMNVKAGLGEYYQIEYKDMGLDLAAKKSLTPLPDGFLQFHLGVAYRIVNPEIKEKKKKEVKDSLK